MEETLLPAISRYSKKATSIPCTVTYYVRDSHPWELRALYNVLESLGFDVAIGKKPSPKNDLEDAELANVGVNMRPSTADRHYPFFVRAVLRDTSAKTGELESEYVERFFATQTQIAQHIERFNKGDIPEAVIHRVR